MVECFFLLFRRRIIHQFVEKFLGHLIAIFASVKVRTFSNQIIFVPFFLLISRKIKKIASDDRFVVNTLFTLLSIRREKIEKKHCFFLFNHVVRKNFSLNKYLFSLSLSLSLHVFVFIMVAFAFFPSEFNEKSNRNCGIRTIVLY